MTTTEYIITEPLYPPGNMSVKARFKSLNDAIIFIRAYMNEYDQQPDLELSIIRRDRIVEEKA